MKVNGHITPEIIESIFEETVELIFNQIPLPIAFVDPECRLVTFNNAFRDFLGIELEKVKGKFAWEVDPNAKFPEILKTNMPEIGVKHRFMGKDIIVHRIPLHINNELIGGISITIIGDLNFVYKLIVENNLIRDLISFEDTQCNISSVYKSKYTWENILGDSNLLRHCKEQAKFCARTDFPILITGESGVGKELFAHAIHNESNRRNNPFIEVNCAAIPEKLIESELFGYEEGAFTGAAKHGRKGKFELANNGTIFLDEIGELPIELQPKLLRILQEKELERVGSNKIINLNLRVIAATNADLKKKVLTNTFRNDLFYRLNSLAIEIPPLRERPSDIPILVKSISDKFHKEYGIIKEISKPVLEALSLYNWPGNVRELVNVINRMMVLSKEFTIGIECLPKEIITISLDKKASDATPRTGLLKSSVSETEKNIIMEILMKNNFNKSKTAKALGIPRMSLYRKLKEIESLNDRS